MEFTAQVPAVACGLKKGILQYRHEGGASSVLAGGPPAQHLLLHVEPWYVASESAMRQNISQETNVEGEQDREDHGEGLHPY